MIRVQAPSRLHFGLLSFGTEQRWSNRLGELVLPARRFGGAGLMVRAPGVRLEVRRARAWSADGPLAERALAFARRLIRTLAPAEAPPLHLRAERAVREHVGLGTGTQLGLAVARAITTSYGMPGMAAAELARRVGRGKRSALGIHGFAQGGFLVEGGKRDPEATAPLVARVAFPEAWRVVLVVPPWGEGLHGESETKAFRRLADERVATDCLCRLVILGMLPALIEQDLEAFGDAVHDFNAHAGEAFARVQGGIYANSRVAELIAVLRQEGIRAVGQSSWGPAVFAVVENDDRAEALARELRSKFGFEGDEVLVTQACNQGAITEEELGD
jgi:beta-RFAP synthase